jgi:hypothetical protein
VVVNVSKRIELPWIWMSLGIIVDSPGKKKGLAKENCQIQMSQKEHTKHLESPLSLLE